jgi:hypothetical protein
MASEEKKEMPEIQPATSSIHAGTTSPDDSDKELESHEVFKKVGDGGVEFRTVSWQRATVIFLKIIFATGVLSIPSAMYSLGAVGGSLLILAFGALNTCKSARLVALTFEVSLPLCAMMHIC